MNKNKETELDLINALTDGLHDRAANINEELVDGNTEGALEEIKNLQLELKHLRSNLLVDRI